MSTTRTLVAALLCAALGAYIYFVEMPRMAEEAKPDNLLDITPADVQSVRLSYPDGTVLRVEFDKGAWRMTEPVDYPADNDAVVNLVSAIAGLELERRLKPDETMDLSTYGLEGNGEQARVELTLAGKDNPPAIIVGRATPVGYSAFARLDNSQEVVVTPLLFQSGMKKTAFDLRDKHLLKIDPSKVSAVSLGGSSADIRLERNGSQWNMSRPIRDLADPAAVRSLINSANEATAIAFVDGDKAVDRAKLGLTEPMLDVSFETGPGSNEGFLVGKLSEDEPRGYYFERKSDGEVAKVVDWMPTSFAKQPDDLRDKHVFRCDFDKVTAMRFAREGGAPFTLRIDASGKWEIDPPDTRAVVKQTAPKRVKDGLAALQGEHIVADDVTSPEELATYAMDKPVLTVSVFGPGDQVCASATVSSPDPSAEEPIYYFRRGGGSTILYGAAHVFSRVDFERDDFLETAEAAGAEAPATGH